MIENIIEIGKVGKPDGIHGYIRLDIDMMYEKSVLKSPFVFLYLDGLPVPYKVEEVKPEKNMIIKLAGVDSPEEASSYIHTAVGLHQRHILGGRKIGLSETEKYLGFEIYNQQQSVGIIQEVNMFPGQIMATVKNEAGKEFLLPLVEEWIKQVLKEKKMVIMELPEGLLNIL